MRIFRRGKQGIFWAQLHDQRVSLGVTDRKAAEAAFRELQRQYSDPMYRAPSTMRLDQCLRTFCDQQAERGRAPGTLRQYEFHAGHMVRILGADLPIARLDAERVDHYLSTRTKERVSSQTRWKELCTLRGALKLARRHKFYPHPLDEVFPEKFEGRESKAGSAHLLLPDVDKLLAVLPEARGAVVAYLVATGADWQSVALATKADVDFKAGTATVHGGKTDYRQREIPILPVFKSLLKRAVAAMPFEPWDSVRRDLEVACRRAGVAKVTPRDLRRSTGRILRVAGVEPQLIGPILGHADGRMVERVYGKLKPKELGALIVKQSARTKPVQRRNAARGKQGESSKKQAAA